MAYNVLQGDQADLESIMHHGNYVFRCLTHGTQDILQTGILINLWQW